MTDDNNTTPAKYVDRDRLAKVIADPHRASAKAYIKIGGFKEEYSYEVTREFERSAQRVAQGDLTGIEEALISQTHLLNAMFINMSKKHAAAIHYQEALAYGSLALRAHSVYRQTLLALSEQKHPKTAAPVHAVQVNIDASGNKSANELLTSGPNATLDS